MHQSKSLPTLMGIEQMYSVTRGENGAWGIEGYEVAKKYFDARKVQEDRDLAKVKKGEKSKKHITKRGHFLDDIAKPFLKYKVPVQYYEDKLDLAEKEKKKSRYKNQKNKTKQRPKSAPPKRLTYIDEIYRANTKKNFPQPAPGAYNVLVPVEEQLKRAKALESKKIKYGERQNFLSDFQFLGIKNPGAGTYNPKTTMFPIIKNKSKAPAEVIKHQKEVEAKVKEGQKRYPNPDVGTYKPFPLDYDVFGKKLQQVHDKVKIDGPKIKYWGNKEPTKSKVEKPKTQQSMPNLIAHWPGKEDGNAKNKDKKLYNWMNKVTKGFETTKSIYY